MTMDMDYDVAGGANEYLFPYQAEIFQCRFNDVSVLLIML